MLYQLPISPEFPHVENMTDNPYKRHIITFTGMPRSNALVNPEVETKRLRDLETERLRERGISNVQ